MPNKQHDTYSTQWESPSQTFGEWRDVVVRDSYDVAKRALDDKVKARKHVRIIVHRDGQEDYTVDERGPFNGPVTAADRR